MSKKKAVSTEKAVANVEANVTKALGRPANPESARQKRIAELEAKRASGTCKRGRPTVAGSKRQEVLAARAAKIANGGELKRGRPVVEGSKRQQALAAKVSGAEVKRGRPSRNSESTAHVTEVVNVEQK
jgi:hypothetical protein